MLFLKKNKLFKYNQVPFLWNMYLSQLVFGNVATWTSSGLFFFKRENLSGKLFSKNVSTIADFRLFSTEFGQKWQRWRQTLLQCCVHSGFGVAEVLENSHNECWSHQYRLADTSDIVRCFFSNDMPRGSTLVLDLTQVFLEILHS